jgi:hypothetical protein
MHGCPRLLATTDAEPRVLPGDRQGRPCHRLAAGGGEFTPLCFPGSIFARRLPGRIQGRPFHPCPSASTLRKAAGRDRLTHGLGSARHRRMRRGRQAADPLTPGASMAGRPRVSDCLPGW